MRTAGRTPNRWLAVLLVWAASRPRTALAEHSKPPCRNDDVVVFYTAKAPPLSCIIDRACDVTNGTEADFRLEARISRSSQRSNYVCKFQESDILNSSALFRDSIPEFPTVFYHHSWITDERVRHFDETSVICLFDSNLPDEFFHFIVQRPHDEAPFKCRVSSLDNSFDVRFPGFPAVICEPEDRRGFLTSTYKFKLPDIVGEPFSCAFLVYNEVKLVDVGTEPRLHRELIRGFPSEKTSGRPRITCSRTETSDDDPDFQIRVAAGDFYNCRFLDPDKEIAETTDKRYFGW